VTAVLKRVELSVSVWMMRTAIAALSAWRRFRTA
jgi:hypothetical protein